VVRELGAAKLKTGERLQRVVLEAPAPEWGGRVEHLLAHKGEHWRWHIHRALHEPLDALETRFYLGLLGDAPVANIMTVEARGIGILGHVFTLPDHRRKGIATALLEVQMEDFRQRGGRILTLGTRFDSPPYWIYHAFGFRSVANGSGVMWYGADTPQLPERWSAPCTGPMRVSWEHWPTLNLLCVQPEGDYLRQVARGVWGQANFEGGFITYKRDLEAENTQVTARVLENAAGLLVGWASLEPHPLWKGQVSLLDLFTHPAAEHAGSDLLAALPLPATPILAYTEFGSAEEKALTRHGFVLEHAWPEWVQSPSGKRGIKMWMRK